MSTGSAPTPGEAPTSRASERVEAPLPPGGQEEGGAADADRRPSWAERTRSLERSLYLLQLPMVILLAIWTAVVRAAIPGWLSIFYIGLFLPMIVAGQLLIWAVSAWANRRKTAKRMNASAAWGYLVFLICFFLLPLILPDGDDQRMVDSVLTAVGVDDVVAFNISLIVMAAGIAAGAVALFCSLAPVEDRPEPSTDQ
ncbi:hypothetical protein [Actinomyces capricornis]|uniref:DUF805 domain-containing protein n=1 Tax=Actinomyces capricornis TaxID=2755559 RepID=A0ABM7U739_9ACTO|nr:hypothetical protein [Actinomyces capricornis]BDA63342.1 hypothetical protein MANAM107_01760 [Actinomyces capricornis]